MARANKIHDKSADLNPPEVEAVEADRDVPQKLARREAVIRELMNKGYKSGNETRKVRSPAHAEFLCRAGTIELPE